MTANRKKISRKLLSLLGYLPGNETAQFYISHVEQRVSELKFKRMIFMASMPKSGGTFLSNKLAEYLGFSKEVIYEKSLRGWSENDILLHRFLDMKSRDVVLHTHVLGNDGNCHHVFNHSDLVIFQTRRIRNVLESFRKHLLGESLFWSFATIDNSFHQLSPSEQIDLLIDLVAPWMLNFYATWEKNLKNSALSGKIIHVSFDELIRDESKCLTGIITQIEGRCDSLKLGNVLNSRTCEDRYKNNRSIEDYTMSDFQFARIANLAKHFRKTDFTPLGI